MIQQRFVFNCSLIEWREVRAAHMSTVVGGPGLNNVRKTTRKFQRSKSGGHKRKTGYLVKDTQVVH